jgi:endonuclease/exonuclease/phosphatase family metal-dependent hydrolase
MRLAVYNVENLFDRAKAMNLGDWESGRAVLEQFAELNKLLGQVEYSDEDRQRMVELMFELGLEGSDTGPFVLLRRNRGKLLKRPRSGGIEIIADGRADWAGSLELRYEPINEVSMRNTARVLIDLDADVLGVIEAESRPVLSAFNREVLPALDGTPYRHVMLIDGNDERGIDVGIMTGPNYPVGLMRSHADEWQSNGEPLFSRDCPEFEIATPSGKLVVLVNHLKSKGYGSPAVSSRKRKAQATRIAEIYRELVAAGTEYVAVIGDLNDTPDSDPLRPLLAETDLRDVFEFEDFDTGGYPGTYGGSTASNKIDYMLFSPALFDRITAGGVFRRGMWPGVRPRKWDAYPEITREVEAASDHAALWADLDL